MSAPAEFSRPERIDTIGDAPRAVRIEADTDERAALARRFALVAIDTLAADLSLHRDAVGIVVTGRVAARATQSCSVTGDPLLAAIDEPIALRFAADIAGEDEVELSGDALDTLPLDGGAIDLGEIAAETLALALDPYPCGPGAAAALRAAGVVSEEEAAAQASPFAALAALARAPDAR